MSLFFQTSRVYENSQNYQINIIKIENSLIATFQKIISRLFLDLDRYDQTQKQISLRLWMLRSSIIFTLLEFDDESLNIKRQLDDLIELCSGYPTLNSAILNLESNIDLILKSSNSKREWFLNILGSNNLKTDSVAVLTRLSFGNSPGWPKDEETLKQKLVSAITYLRSSREYKNRLFDKVVFPCGCSNCPSEFLRNLIYSGITSSIDVLLYSGEKFNLPHRLKLPVDEKLISKYEESVVDKSFIEIPQLQTPDIIDDWMNNSFWSEIHTGARSFSDNLVPSHYVLFNNGTGTFLPKNGKAQVINEFSDQSFSSENIIAKRVEELNSGDLVILRSGDSVFLLDCISDNILHEIGSGNLLEDATEWKAGLEALLQTHTWEEVAEMLKIKHVNVNPVTIERWAGSEGLGPGNKTDFEALIYLLIESKKIILNTTTPDEYITEKWSQIQRLRGIRHKAGQRIRNELFETLAKNIKNQIGQIGDKSVVKMDLASGAELSILRIFAIDHSLSYIHPSKIGRLDDLRNNKWLG